MFQTPLPYWKEYQWREQPVLDEASWAIHSEQVLDISSCLTGDQLIWEAPAGKWIIMRTGMCPTGVTNSPAEPIATGLEVDKMSREHVAAHFEAYMGEIIRRIPEADRKCWKVVYRTVMRQEVKTSQTTSWSLSSLAMVMIRYPSCLYIMDT